MGVPEHQHPRMWGERGRVRLLAGERAGMLHASTCAVPACLPPNRGVVVLCHRFAACKRVRCAVGGEVQACAAAEGRSAGPSRDGQRGPPTGGSSKDWRGRELPSSRHLAGLHNLLHLGDGLGGVEALGADCSAGRGEGGRGRAVGWQARCRQCQHCPCKALLKFHASAAPTADSSPVVQLPMVWHLRVGERTRRGG